MKKILYFLIILILGLFVLTTPSLAMTKTAGEMTINYDEPLFPNTTVWYPGLTLRNTIEVINTGGSIRSLGIRAVNTAQTGGLADVLIFKIDDGGHYVFGGNGDKRMKDFWNEGDFEVANLGPYETKTIGFTISMPGSLGNEYQGTQAQFDIMIGFLNQSSVILTATNTTDPSTGTVLAVTSNPFAGFFGPFEEVLGESTTIINTAGQVKGISTKNSSIWDFILPSIIPVTLGGIGWFFRKKLFKK